MLWVGPEPRPNFVFDDACHRILALSCPGQRDDVTAISFVSLKRDISSQPPNTDTVVIKLSRHGAPPPTLLPDSLFRWASCVTQPSL